MPVVFRSGGFRAGAGRQAGRPGPARLHRAGAGGDRIRRADLGAAG